MPDVIRRDLIRAQINVRSTEAWQDLITAASPDAWAGTDLAFQLGLFADKTFTTLVDGAAYSSITIEVKPNDDRTAAALMEKTIAGPFTNPSLSDWLAGTAQHAEIAFTFEETELDLGDANEKTFWVVVSAITNDVPGRNVTLGCTTLVIKQDGHVVGATSPTPGDPLYLTEAQSDARYMLKAGGTFTGAFDFSGTNHFGVKNISLTTTQRDALTAAGGHVVYNSTTTRTEFYDNGAWRSFVRLAGDTMTGHLLFTDNTLDVGASGATRPRTGYFGTSVVAPSFVGTLTGSASLNLLLAGGTLTGPLLFTDNTLDIGAAGATRPRTGYFGTSVVAPLFTGALTGAASLNVLKAGDTMTNFLVLHANPTSNLHAATKQYVDGLVAGGLSGYMNLTGENPLNTEQSWYINSNNVTHDTLFDNVWHCNYLSGEATGLASGGDGGYDGDDNPCLISRIGMTEILTRKTIRAAVFEGTQTGTATFDGMTYDTPTLTTPVINGAVTGSAVYTGQTFQNGTMQNGEWNFHLSNDADLSLVQRIKNNGGNTGAPGSAVIQIETVSGSWRTYNFGLYDDSEVAWTEDQETVMRRLDVDNHINDTLRGFAYGLASLDSGGKIPTSQIPDSVLGQVEYQGSWDANTNDPTIPVAALANKGYYYIVSVAGASSQGGITDWKVGDWIISNGTTWQKVDNTDQVTTVFGRTGAIVATSGDYTTALVTESGSLYFTEARVRATVLTGYASGANSVLSATDSILTTFGKVQGQLDAKLALAGGTMTGALLFTDNTIDIGAAGATRPRTIYVGTSIRTPQLNNNAGVIGIEGVTSSFPGLKRSSAVLEVRLGDDSAYAVLKCKQMREEVATVAYAGSVAINFDAAAIQEITATGNLTLTTSNLAAGKSVTVRILASGTTVTMTYPAWIAFGAALPATIPTGKALYLTLNARGAADANVDAISIAQV